MSVLLEHKLITVLAITMIFALSGVLFSFIDIYTKDSITNIEQAGSNAEFRNIQWVGAIN